MSSLNYHHLRRASLSFALLILCIPQGYAADPIGLNAVYLTLGSGYPPDPVSVMSASGIRQFALAFVVSDGGCNPKWTGWDGLRELRGGTEQATINRIRAAGGDVVVSVGGAGGYKLGERCSSASALATAYQKVINAFKLKAIDIDIEGSEIHASSTVRQRVISALKIIQNNNGKVKST